MYTFVGIIHHPAHEGSYRSTQMNRSEAATILQDLLDGLDPVSGGRLPEPSPYHDPRIIRALACAVIHLGREELAADGVESQPADFALAGAEGQRDYERAAPWEEVPGSETE